MKSELKKKVKFVKKRYLQYIKFGVQLIVMVLKNLKEFVIQVMLIQFLQITVEVVKILKAHQLQVKLIQFTRIV